MPTSLQLLFVMLIVITGCRNKPAAPVSCGENPGPPIFIFVGEKIKVEELIPEPTGMDGKFLAQYKIVEKVCGQYTGDTITFIAYDHYGWPAFAESKNALLFLTPEKDTFYHIKYQYCDVYKTVDGRWAGPVSMQNALFMDSLPQHLQPKPIAFKEKVAYDLTGKKKRIRRVYYPAPYYAIQRNEAVALQGIYLPELVEIKKRGTLRARRFFGNKEPEKEVEVRDVVIFSDINLNKKKNHPFHKNWLRFFNAIRRNDTATIKLMSADSVTCSICEGLPQESFDNEKEPIDSFIKAVFSVLKKDSLWQTVLRQKGNRSISFIDVTDDGNNILSPKDSAVHYVVTFNKELHTEWSVILQSHRFLFKKVGSTFVFIGVESH